MLQCFREKDVSTLISCSYVTHQQKDTSTTHVTVPGSDKRGSETLSFLFAAIKGTTGPIVPLRHPKLWAAVFVCVL